MTGIPTTLISTTKWKIQAVETDNELKIVGKVCGTDIRRPSHVTDSIGQLNQDICRKQFSIHQTRIGFEPIFVTFFCYFKTPKRKNTSQSICYSTHSNLPDLPTITVLFFPFLAFPNQPKTIGVRNVMRPKSHPQRQEAREVINPPHFYSSLNILKNRPRYPQGE